ncbi:MAG: PilN domain-containing protein [Candidatus Moranbacteria bacterium]|nr:PilN domain-containing protein [Candidatus Moranbacteria bacterium]
MKIYLDLLPKERKKEIRRKRIFRDILREEFLFLSPILVFVVILLNIYYLLSFEQKTSLAMQSSEQSQDKYQKLNAYEEKFKQVNATTTTLLKIQSGHLHWYNVFAKMEDVVPEGIDITNFSTKDYAIFLVGKAKNRDVLLGFKNKLEANGCFSNVNVPLSNLVVKEDIDFQIDFMVKDDCLRNK